uniref:Uncharacterized protein n=1 Tax=Arundo donax TaxID=35708 RepID=A0A0A9DDE4_ARUDO
MLILKILLKNDLIRTSNNTGVFFVFKPTQNCMLLSCTRVLPKCGNSRSLSILSIFQIQLQIV